MLTMAPTVDTMSMPSTSFLLDAVADAAAAEHQSSDINPDATSSAAATAAAEMAAAESDSAAATTTTTTTYTTPQRLAGLAAVTPSTLPPGDGQFAVGEHDHHEHVGGVGSPEKNVRGQGDDVVVSASSTEEVVAARASLAAPAAHAAPAAAHASAAVTHATTSAIAAAKWSSKAVAALAPTPSIQLGPRVTPAVRNNPPQTDMKPRNLDGALKTGESKLNTSQLSASAEVAAASAAHPAVKLEECPTTPAAQHHNVLPPSSFLAAKISPLRSSSARRNGEKKGAASAAAAMPKREHTPPPPVASSNLDPTKLSPGMFLSPRTPKPGYPHTNAMQGTKTSGMTPGLTPGLTPTNFASDFGRGDRMKEAGSMNALDASNVFAWLHSPGGQGLFSPTGGLNSLSVTNTPRGMYGFNGPTGLTGKAGGPPKLAPSLAPSSSGHAHHQGFFAELEAGGDLGVNTPKIPECQRSMISISPLASRKSGRNRAHAFGVEAAPDTPMSINFSEVFASPRLPTPRLSSRRSPMNSAVKKEVGTSSMDGLPSPVASALHTAERDINLDDDLNALLQLAETTTPGGRPMTFMSPLLTNSLRRATNAELDRNGPEPPSSLQLPIISGSSFSELGSPYKKLSRKGSSSSATENISPPQLAIRSTSSGVMDGSPSKSSLKKKSKKRQTPDVAGSSSAGGEYYGQQQQQQQMGYSQRPSMPHYRHTQAAQAAAAAAHHHGYYHQHPGYHTSSHHAYAYPAHAAHPAPQQHYAYSDQQQAEAAAAAAAMASPAKEELIKPSPVKSSSRKKSSRSRSKPKSATKTPIKSKSPVTIKKVDSRPTTPSSTSSGRRVRKSSAKASSAASASKKNKNAVSDPADKQRITAAIFAVNTVYGDGNEKEKKLAAATLRGVTMRPSGKWQAQLYYAGKSRYIGVFDSKEKASLAYEIAREVLKTDSREEGPTSAEETDRNVCLARKAAHAGVNEHATK